MDIQIKCKGDQEKDILEHREKEYPHLLKSSMSTYFLQIAKEKIAEDKKRGKT